LNAAILFTVIFLILKITYRDFADFYHRDFLAAVLMGKSILVAETKL